LLAFYNPLFRCIGPGGMVDPGAEKR